MDIFAKSVVLGSHHNKKDEEMFEFSLLHKLLLTQRKYSHVPCCGHQNKGTITEGSMSAESK